MRKILYVGVSMLLMSGAAFAQASGNSGGNAGGGNGVKPPQSTQSGALNNPNSRSAPVAVGRPTTTGTTKGVVTRPSAGAPATKGSEGSSSGSGAGTAGSAGASGATK